MNFSDIIGKTITEIEQSDGERIIFHFDDGAACESVHIPDCCESVEVNRIEGSLHSILGHKITEAVETHDSETDQPEDWSESWTWTRQRIRTEAGEVTFVWLGTSNGYYDETPYFQRTHGKKV